MLEVMVAVLVFAIGVAALLLVFTASSTMARRGDAAYAAYNLARSRAELLRASDFSSLSTFQETAVRVDAQGEEDATGDFLRTTTVTPSYLGESDLAQIDVQVSYYQRGVMSSTPMELTTVVYEGG